MSKAGRARTRKSEIRLKHKRQAKIQKLKTQFLAAKSEDTKKDILAKLFRIAPDYPIAQLSA